MRERKTQPAINFGSSTRIRARAGQPAPPTSAKDREIRALLAMDEEASADIAERLADLRRREAEARGRGERAMARHLQQCAAVLAGWLGEEPDDNAGAAGSKVEGNRKGRGNAA